MPTITPEIQAELYKETDARFAAQTGITRKLDPKSKLDQAWIPVWMHLYAQVKQQYDAGILAWTYNHPAVAGPLSEAQAAGLTAAQHFDAATAAPPTDAASHAKASSDATAHAAAASKQAGAAQAAIVPSVASPDLGHLITATASHISDALHTVGDLFGLSGGHDAIAAVQSTQAPAHAVSVNAPAAPSAASTTSALTPSGAGDHVADLGHGPRSGKIDGKKALLGIGIASAFYGVVVLATHIASKRHRHRARARSRYARARRR